jgi:hypothetical protein
LDWPASAFAAAGFFAGNKLPVTLLSAVLVRGKFFMSRHYKDAEAHLAVLVVSTGSLARREKPAAVR